MIKRGLRLVKQTQITPRRLLFGFGTRFPDGKVKQVDFKEIKRRRFRGVHHYNRDLQGVDLVSVSVKNRLYKDRLVREGMHQALLEIITRKNQTAMNELKSLELGELRRILEFYVRNPGPLYKEMRSDYMGVLVGLCKELGQRSVQASYLGARDLHLPLLTARAVILDILSHKASFQGALYFKLIEIIGSTPNEFYQLNEEFLEQVTLNHLVNLFFLAGIDLRTKILEKSQKFDEYLTLIKEEDLEVVSNLTEYFLINGVYLENVVEAIERRVYFKREGHLPRVILLVAKLIRLENAPNTQEKGFGELIREFGVLLGLVRSRCKENNENYQLELRTFLKIVEAVRKGLGTGSGDWGKDDEEDLLELSLQLHIFCRTVFKGYTGVEDVRQYIKLVKTIVEEELENDPDCVQKARKYCFLVITNCSTRDKKYKVLFDELKQLLPESKINSINIKNQ